MINILVHGKNPITLVSLAFLLQLVKIDCGLHGEPDSICTVCTYAGVDITEALFKAFKNLNNFMG